MNEEQALVQSLISYLAQLEDRNPPWALLVIMPSMNGSKVYMNGDTGKAYGGHTCKI